VIVRKNPCPGLVKGPANLLSLAAMTRTITRSKLLAGAALLAAAMALAGCETTSSAGPQAAAKPADPPMTHTRAARECWMMTEKGRADINLDKRADIVTRCIDQKMRTAQAPADGRQANAKKP
jgi:hypothetical protein